MSTYFNSAYVLYILTGFVAVFLFYLSRTGTYLTWGTKASPVTRVVIDEELVENPIVTDLLADLFMGSLGGYVIGLIGGEERERLYYQQILDLIYVKFVKVSKSNLEPYSMTIESFVLGMQEEISRLPTVKLQKALEDRLNDLVGYISESYYYQHTGLVEVRDIYITMTRSLSLIQRHGIIPHRT